MANKDEKEGSATKKKKESTIQVHDLEAKKEVKGGAQNGHTPEKRPPTKTGEVDFMNWE